MAAAVQRNAIETDRHRFTLRQTRRTVFMTFSWGMSIIFAQEASVKVDGIRFSGSAR